MLKTPVSEPTLIHHFSISVLLSPPQSVLPTSLFSWDTVEIPHSTELASDYTKSPKMGFSAHKAPAQSLLEEKKMKCWNAHCISFPLALSLRLTVLFTVPPGDKLLVPQISFPTPRGRQSSSVPLNLLNVELASKLIHVLPHATQPRPQRLIVLSIGCPWRHFTVVWGAPVRLLDGGVWRHVPGDLALFGPRLNVLQAVFVCRWVVTVTLSRAPESKEALVWLTAVFACYSKAAKAVEIPKFLWKGRKFFFRNIKLTFSRKQAYTFNKYVKPLV